MYDYADRQPSIRLGASSLSTTATVLGRVDRTSVSHHGVRCAGSVPPPTPIEGHSLTSSCGPAAEAAAWALAAWALAASSASSAAAWALAASAFAAATSAAAAAYIVTNKQTPVELLLLLLLLLLLHGLEAQGVRVCLCGVCWLTQWPLCNWRTTD